MDKKESSKGYEMIQKPRPDKYLKMQRCFVLTADTDTAKIQPEVLSNLYFLWTLTLRQERKKRCKIISSYFFHLCKIFQHIFIYLYMRGGYKAFLGKRKSKLPCIYCRNWLTLTWLNIVSVFFYFIRYTGNNSKIWQQRPKLLWSVYWESRQKLPPHTVRPSR